MKKYEKFFNLYAGYGLSTMVTEGEYDMEIEDLYQAFKARLIDELLVDMPLQSHYGKLMEEK